MNKPTITLRCLMVDSEGKQTDKTLDVELVVTKAIEKAINKALDKVEEVN